MWPPNNPKQSSQKCVLAFRIFYLLGKGKESTKKTMKEEKDY